MSTDYPGLPYVQAKGYSAGRPDGQPLWLVFHTMEVGESGTAAEGTADYFADPGDGRNVSSHTCVDANSAVQCVRVGDQAWCAGNRPGNRRGIHIEQAGRAAQSSQDWQDDYSQALIRRVAAVHAVDVVRFGIPIRWLSVAQVKAGDKGFCTHNDLRLAFGGTTHWDPGPNYPKDQVLALFRQEVAKLTNGEEDMGTVESLTPAALKQIVDAIVWRPAHTWEQLKDGKPVGTAGSLLNTFMATHYRAGAAQRDAAATRAEVAKVAAAVAAIAAGGADDATKTELADAVERMEALAAEDRQREEQSLAAAAQQHAALVELLGQYQSGEKDAEAIVNELLARLATLAPQPAPQPS